MKGIIFRNNFFVSFVLVLAFLLLLGLSSVSADEYYFSSGNITNASLQGVIDNNTPDEVIINLDDGEYSLGQINVTRNATIQGNSSGNVKIAGSGILFNITSSNVKIINLTITGYTSAIVGNSGDLTVIGNNVTTSGVSISISGSGGNLSNIVIEDNVIVSSVSNGNYGAVFVNGNGMAVSFVSFINNSIRGNGTSNSNGVRINSRGINNLTFDGNNITRTSGTGITLSVHSSNNTNITFANNIITGGPSHSIGLEADSSNNTNITFTNNNITGGDYGVYMHADKKSKNNNITFANNNITGRETYLELSNSSNTNIIFTDNNITATYGYGVSLSVHSSSNTNITFTDNNITGTSGSGVYLVAYRSNNTNIICTDNNITGTSGNGLSLEAYTNNNTNIIFANNNITGGGHGVYISFNSYQGDLGGNNTNVSGFMFLNNTINATGGSGFYFVDTTFNQRPKKVVDFIIRGNTIFASNTVLGFDSSADSSPTNFSLFDVIVEYNRILSPVGVNFNGSYSNSSFDYNWWGDNSPPSGVTVNYYFVVNVIIQSLFGGHGVFNYTIGLNDSEASFDASLLPEFFVYGNSSLNNTVADARNNNSLELDSDTSSFVFNFTIDNQTFSFVSDVYVNNTGGDDDNVGDSWNTAVATIKRALELVVPGGTIHIAGTGTDYTGVNNTNLIINKPVNIVGEYGNVKIDGSGTLFNITASNVKIINLTITGYTSAIVGNSSDLTVTGNNITTSGVSISISGSGGDLSNIVIEDNFIVSSVSNIGAVFVNGNGMAISFVSFINNSIRGNGIINSSGVRINSKGISNLIFDGNNITGKSRGVYLVAYSSNNTNITFANNNITGVSYGVYVYSYDGNVSGVLFLNNTINATVGSGFYFVNDGSSAINVTDFVIRGNNIFASNAGLNFSGLKTGSLVNVNVEYNRIIANTGVNMAGFDNGSSFDFNWWGVNDITDLLLGVDTVNHFILNVTNLTSLDDLRFGDNVSFAFLVLNTSMNNSGVEYLPYFVVNCTYNNQNFTVDNFGNFTGNWTMSSGTQVVAATLDSQYAVLAFNTNSSIIVSDVSIGDTVVISGQLSNYTGDGSDSLTVIVDRNTHSVSINSTGGWNLSYLTNLIGNITVTVSFNGNESYTAFTNTTSFVVVRLASNSSINIPENIKVSQTVLISGVLNDKNSIPIADANLEVIVGGESFNVTTDSVGVWSLNFTPERVGVFNLFLVYLGDDWYAGFVENKAFNVSKLTTNSTIVVPDGVHVGDTAVITGQLANYTVIGFVNVTVDGKSYTVVVDSTGGNWTVNHLTNHTGVYNMTVSYTESDTSNYTSFTNTTSFNVLKNSTNSSISVVDVQVGTNATITGVLANFTVIGFVNVTVDGIFYSNVVVDSTGGNWSVSHLTNHTGTHDVIVGYIESDTGNYTGFSNSTSFDVVKLASNSSINIPGNIKVNQTVLISGVLTDENAIPIADANLEVIVGGESFYVTTDSFGGWSLNFTPEHSGVFNLFLVYWGDDWYVGFVENMAFNVSKLATTSSIVIPSNVKVDKSITVSGVLTSGGKPLANRVISVVVEGKTYKVITNGDGVWKLSYTPKKAGKSTMKVSFAGGDVFAGFNVSKSFDVIGKAKIQIVKITKIAKVGKYKGFNLYSKTYTIKNVGSAVGSKEYTKYFKNWYLEKLSKNNGVKYQFSAKSRILKVQFKNLGVGKQVKFKIYVTFKKRQ
ncbi:beta strand repeat-containing protein [Methanobrevibacter arboriphilus]|uniref:beta strand repeat-containing protein n=1 Tax=Methanobrevibacter arboriphilus TaxID=39441 RepID=UPI001C7F7FEE|nr:right-handed parallel beta-helix repeat-containing protein [Methanobrevibacter arboriphilus]